MVFCFFFRYNFNKSRCKNIFLVSSHSRTSPLVFAPTQLTISPSSTTCVVDYFQRLRFENIQSPDNFTGKLKTQINIYIYIAHHIQGQCNIPISPQKQINVYIYIAHHLQRQWHSLIFPQIEKPPFLDSYYCHMTCTTHIRPSCLTKNRPPNMLQRHLYPLRCQTCPLTN